MDCELSKWGLMLLKRFTWLVFKDILVGWNSFQIYLNESVSVLARTELDSLHFQIYWAYLLIILTENEYLNLSTEIII